MISLNLSLKRVLVGYLKSQQSNCLLWKVFQICALVKTMGEAISWQMSQDWRDKYIVSTKDSRLILWLKQQHHKTYRFDVWTLRRLITLVCMGKLIQNYLAKVTDGTEQAIMKQATVYECENNIMKCCSPWHTQYDKIRQRYSFALIQSKAVISSYHIHVSFSPWHTVDSVLTAALLLMSRLTHLPWTKWPPFHRRYFQCIFREWKVLYFD